MLRVFLGSRSFGEGKRVAFSSELAILTKTSQTLQINLYNFSAPSKPGFPSFLRENYIKFSLWMSRQIIEIVRHLTDPYPEYRPDEKDAK